MPEARARDANSRIGTIGAAVRNSQSTKRAANTRPDISAPMTSALAHPTALPRNRLQTSASAASATSDSPGMSNAAAGPKLSRNRASTRAIAIRPIGRLIQNTQRQPRCSVMKPPMAGPMISAHPVMLLKMPSARARSSRPNVPLRIAIASGITSAAPAPCNARAAISAVALPASAQAADATTNRAIPAANMRRRSKRSPSAAPVKSSTAKVRLKALTVHCSVSTGLPNSARMAANAVVMIMASSAIMKDASAVTPSTQFCSTRLVGVCIALSPCVAPPYRGAFCGLDEAGGAKDAPKNNLSRAASFGCRQTS
ncbi:hypothetical protein ACVIWV_000489 [Bradyrhizobium diazoefficiens]|uniref:Uncharacterized protein n=1 Tax=Bradyrhizobium diazoefficiens TaxID=1355477 RepID=A0A0E4BM36_9BRAD|nr:hypothetical protein NK6_1779 [Bradyrhizobium diazoefficiens]